MARKIKICGVYKITSPNNRIYVGSSSDIQSRFCFYKTGATKSQWLLKRSFDKYGIENHKFEIIEQCKEDEKFFKESYYGNLYKSLSDFGGLNLVLPKSDKIPYTYSNEIRNKMSEIAKKRVHTEETKRKCSAARKGKYQNGMHPLAKTLLNLETGIYYDCIKEAAFYFGIKRTALSMKLIGKNKNNTPFIYA